MHASRGTRTACCLMAAAGRMTSWSSRAPCPAARFPSASVCLQRVSGHGCLTDRHTALRLCLLLPLHGRHSRSLALSPAHFLVWRVQLEHFRLPAASTRCCCPLRRRFQRGIPHDDGAADGLKEASGHWAICSFVRRSLSRVFHSLVLSSTACPSSLVTHTVAGHSSACVIADGKCTAAAPRQTRMAITTRAGSLADLRTAWARSLQPAAAFCTRANLWQTR